MQPAKQPGAPLPFEGVLNFRDLGGWPAGRGRRVKYGLFFRGPQLDTVCLPGDKALLESLGLKTCLDFRSTMEREHHPDPPQPGMTQLCLSAILDEKGREINFDPERGMSALTGAAVEETLRDMDVFYKRMPFQNPAYRRFFHEVRQGNVPMYFHCTAGKDRTGVAAALLLLTLGVRRRDVEAEYMLSSHCRAPLFEEIKGRLPRELLDHPRIKEFLLLTVGVRKELLALSLDAIQQAYGSFDTYLKAEYEIDEEERSCLRALYTEPA